MFDDTIDSFNQVFAGLNIVWLLCISGLVALAFIGLLVYDARRRKRNRQRFGRGRSGNLITSCFRSVRSNYRTLLEEMGRRRRRIERERGHRK